MSAAVDDGEASRRQAKGGRPRSEAREALAAAARWWQGQRTYSPLEGLDGELLIGATWYELRQRACLARGHGANVLKNMVRDGELRKIGRTMVEGYDRAMGVYAPCEPELPRWAQGLDDAMAAITRTPG